MNYRFTKKICLNLITRPFFPAGFFFSDEKWEKF